MIHSAISRVFTHRTLWVVRTGETLGLRGQVCVCLALLWNLVGAWLPSCCSMLLSSLDVLRKVVKTHTHDDFDSVRSEFVAKQRGA